MSSSSDEISQTVPRRGAPRETTRVPVLAGTGNVRHDALPKAMASRVVAVGEGIDIGRRPPPAADGRGTLTLPDKSVSGLHARIVRGGPTSERSEIFEIQDLGSTNGTSVAGRQLTASTPLRSGAVIFMGAQVLVFRFVTPAELLAIEEDAEHPFAPVPTLSPTLAMVCSRLRRLAPSQSEIFLIGETGVGKEVFARAIHQTSKRTGQLIAINCAAIPRELVESELFGYEKGAHSTAQARKTGFIEAAEGGTLFLDELAEMPIELQSKLLRFIQDRKFSPLGSTRLIEADVRIIAASSRSVLAGKSGGSSVQAALLGRLGAFPIQLPALRDRIEDLGSLAAFFLRGSGERSFETEAFQALCLHEWPHNVRELQKVIAEAELLSAGAPAISFDHLPESITALVEPIADGPGAAGEPGDEVRLDGVVQGVIDPAVKTARTRRPAPTADELLTLLTLYQGNVAHVARHLKRQYAVVWRCIQRYGIAADSFRPGGGPALPENANPEPAADQSDEDDLEPEPEKNP